MKKFFLRISILGIYGIFGITFQIFLAGCVNYLQFTDIEKFIFIATLVNLEAIFFICLYDYKKTDFFGIEKYKINNTPPTSKILKVFYYLKNIKNKLLAVIIFPLCFLIIVLAAGPVITTILFRNSKPYPGFISKETLLYYMPACGISITIKYFGFAKLPTIAYCALKDTYFQISSYLW